MSLVSGENLPMIHSMRSIGIESIRYPITTIQTKIKRIIMWFLILSGRGFLNCALVFFVLYSSFIIRD